MKENDCAKAAGMRYAGTIHGHYAEGCKPDRDYYLYVQTGGDRMLRIRHVRPNYDVVTDGNGGFGQTWACHGDTAVYTRF
jgi:hypothetical protein